MEPTTIFLSACVIVLIYLVYYTYTFNASLLLSSITPGNTVTTITPPVPADGVLKQSFTFSIWVNINDWNVNKGFYKNIISYGTSVYISLAPTTNDVILSLKTDSTPTYKTMSVVKNIPLQTWVHLAFTLEGATLDTYMNGRIVTTNLVGASYVSPSSNDKITLAGDNKKPNPCAGSGADLYTASWSAGKTAGCGFAPEASANPGFSGWITQFQYSQMGTDPQGIWNIYQQGNGAGVFSNFFGNYGLSIALTNNGVAQNSISI
jgi:hypothetical protein